jgi:hypothetical protein
MKIATSLLLVCAFIPLIFQGMMIDRMKKQIVTSELNYAELKQHTDILAQVVRTQQYQIDVITENIMNQ